MAAVGRVMPSPVRLLLGAAVLANIGLIAHTVYDNQRRKSSLDLVMKDALPSEAVVQAGFPSAALELLVVESRGVSRGVDVPLVASNAPLRR